MTKPIRLTLEQTLSLRDRIEAAAAARGMTVTSFCNGVLGDYLSESEARTQPGDHACCFCRDRRPTGEARCCRCDTWSAPRARVRG